MHEGMQHDLIQGQGQGHEPKIGNPAIFNTNLMRHLQRQLATCHVFLNYSTISTFDQADFSYLS